MSAVAILGAMRLYLKAQWCDFQGETVDYMSNREVIRAIADCYAGGVARFVEDST